MNRIIIRLEDRFGEAMDVMIETPTPSVAMALVCLDFFERHSAANVVGYGVFFETNPVKTLSESAYESVLQQLSVSCIDRNTGKWIYFKIPAPADEIVTSDQKATSAIMKDVKTLLGNLAREVTIRNSGLTSREEVK